MKKSELSISLNQQSQMFCSLLLLYIHVNVYRNMLKLRCGLLALTLDKERLENKKIFCMTVKEKYFSRYIVLTDQI